MPPPLPRGTANVIPRLFPVQFGEVRDAAPAFRQKPRGAGVRTTTEAGVCRTSVSREGESGGSVRVDADPMDRSRLAPDRQHEQREAEDDHHRRNHEREHEERIGHDDVSTQLSFTLKFRVTESTNGVAVPFSTSGA